jgi:hypothetical protein
MSLIPNWNAIPGVQGYNVQDVSIDVFQGGREKANWIPIPLTIDGTYSACAQNSPYTAMLMPGTLMGRDVKTRKYRNVIIGATTALINASGSVTSFTTDANTTTEIARLLGLAGGSSLALNLVGPPSANGSVAAVVNEPVVCTAAGGTTITVTSVSLPTMISGSLICPANSDGTASAVSANLIATLLCDMHAISLGWPYPNATTRVDANAAMLLAGGGGQLNGGNIWQFPSDTGLQQWIINALQSACPGTTFIQNWT